MTAPGAPRIDSTKPISLAEKLAGFTEHWQPRTVAEFNGHDIMVVKAQGEFVWHKHDETDDLFLVLRGELTIELRAAVARERGEVLLHRHRRAPLRRHVRPRASAAPSRGRRCSGCPTAR